MAFLSGILATCAALWVAGCIQDGIYQYRRYGQGES